MKKITLTILLFFLSSLAAIYTAGFIFSGSGKSSQKSSSELSFGNNQNVSGNIYDKKTGQNKNGRRFSLAEAARHNSPRDCYLVIRNKVYDVSSYINYHPGGRRSIISRCGKEVSGIFAAIHSNFAWNLLKKYYVGYIGQEQNDKNFSQIAGTFKRLESSLKKNFPGIDIISIKPKNKGIYVAKAAYKNSLYEIHLDSSGRIIKREVENDEYNWNFWDRDKDDIIL